MMGEPSAFAGTNQAAPWALHEDADGFALRVRAQVDGGRELFNYTADNYTSKVWKTSYQDIQDIIDDLFNVVGDIVEQIRSNAYRWEG